MGEAALLDLAGRSALHPHDRLRDVSLAAAGARAAHGDRGRGGAVDLVPPEICRERRIGLTALYNQLDEGAWTELRDLHVELDGLVGAAYGWEPGVARSPVDSNARLSELNGRIARGEVGYDPFGVR